MGGAGTATGRPDMHTRTFDSSFCRSRLVEDAIFSDFPSYREREYSTLVLVWQMFQSTLWSVLIFRDCSVEIRWNTKKYENIPCLFVCVLVAVTFVQELNEICSEKKISVSTVDKIMRERVPWRHNYIDEKKQIDRFLWGRSRHSENPPVKTIVVRPGDWLTDWLTGFVHGCSGAERN